VHGETTVGGNGFLFWKNETVTILFMILMVYMHVLAKNKGETTRRLNESMNEWIIFPSANNITGLSLLY